MVLKQYISYIVNESAIDKQEILVAILSDFGFEGYQHDEYTLTANGDYETVNQDATEAFLAQKHLGFTKEIIQEQNWNEQWEQSFQPIVVDNFCAVRASFHLPVESVEHEIIITPKMSFGTGHHATTYMMLQAMKRINTLNKTVIDFGTGTGILAILAEKMGATRIYAIDNDDWCIENGTENILSNNCSKIELYKASDLEHEPQVDIILANINKHVILANLETMKSKLRDEGLLLISGILKTDEQDILEAAKANGFYKKDIVERNGWLCICFGFN